MWYLKISFDYGFLLLLNKSVLFSKHKYFIIFLNNIIILLKLFENSKWVYFDPHLLPYYPHAHYWRYQTSEVACGITKDKCVDLYKGQAE